MNKSYNHIGFKWACKNGYIEIVKYLCEIFKDPEMNKNNIYLGFEAACVNEHIEIVKYLFETFKDP